MEDAAVVLERARKQRPMRRPLELSTTWAMEEEIQAMGGAATAEVEAQAA